MFYNSIGLCANLGLSWCTGTRGNSYCFHNHTWTYDAVRYCFLLLCTGTRGHNRKFYLTRFDHQVRHESKITLQKYSFLASYCCQFQITVFENGDQLFSTRLPLLRIKEPSGYQKKKINFTPWLRGIVVLVDYCKSIKSENHITVFEKISGKDEKLSQFWLYDT